MSQLRALPSAQWHAGLLGYFYHQLNGDSGPGPRLGSFKSRVSAVGYLLSALGDGRPTAI